MAVPAEALLLLGWLTVPAEALLLRMRRLVGEAGVEPARLIQPGDFKSPVSTIPPPAHTVAWLDNSQKKMVCQA